MKSKLKYLFILLIIPFLAKSQSFNLQKGVPFIKNYSTEQYKAHEQNFQIVQSVDGVIFDANFEAVLIFNGAVWKKIPTSKGFRVLSLCSAPDTTIYVGGLYDFGYIKKDKFGQYKYKTLVDSNMKEDFVDEIFAVKHLSEKTYFFNKKRMFVYDGKKIETIEFIATLNNVILENEQLFLFFEKNLKDTTLVQNGLTIFKNNKFEKIQDKSLEQIVDVKMIALDNTSNEYLIATESQGFFKLKNNIITSFDEGINSFAIDNSITCGVKVNENTILIGTSVQGVYFLDENLNILSHIDKKSLLVDNAVKSVYKDIAGNIWVATDNGISLIEINNPLSIITNQISGIEGKLNKIIEFDNNLFIATNDGLFKMNDNNISRIFSEKTPCRDALVLGNILYIAAPTGVLQLKDNYLIETSIKDFTFCLLKPTEPENLIYIGLNSKILIAEIVDDNLIVIDSITGFEGNVLKIAKDYQKDVIYIEVPPDNIYKFYNNTKQIKKISTGDNYISLHLNSLNGKVFFSSEKGNFIETENIDTLIAFDELNLGENQNKIWIYDLFEIDSENYLITDGSQKNVNLLQKTTDGYKLFNNDFLPVSDYTIRNFYYDKNQKNVWFTGIESMIIYDISKKFEHKTPFKVVIDKITCLQNDSLLKIINPELVKIKYSENSLKFEFYAPYYPAKGEVMYSTFLSGFDKAQSEWSAYSTKEYSNLPAGNYVLTIYAKDQFGNTIETTEFSFKILVPLYRRWWAILIYVVVLGFLIKLFVDWRMKIAEQENQRLEDIIKDRTAEIEKSKAEIEAQRDIEYKQRKEIMSSIHYAKRIQQAVLPSPEILLEILKDNYFVLFRPYEVVSGDYFWIKQMKNFIVVVAADCTGHGVPGAFMSMLGTSFLNEIVTRRSLDNTAEILERLRQKVKSSLHQEGKLNEQKDGMDIAIYLVDTESNDLQYSGAYNSLYIVRHIDKISDDFKQKIENEKNIKLFFDETADPSYGLIELKANRQPIGIYIKEVPFENINLKLEKGDCIYSFSDGYQDQFGGDTGEKFNAKRFKSLLISIQGKSMEEQRRIVEHNFLKWKGDLQQVDDVLVFGLKYDL